MAAKHHQILIVGGGAAGITVAAHLQRLDDHHALDIAIIDPAESHYYQAAFTLVGGGAYKLEDTRRATKDLIPGGVTWIKEAVATFSPDTNSLTLANGTNGQIKTIVCTAVTAAGTATLTPTTCSGFTTVAFTAAGQTLTLQYFTTGGWHLLSVRGATPA